jgi:hypothetical protein
VVELICGEHSGGGTIASRPTTKDLWNLSASLNLFYNLQSAIAAQMNKISGVIYTQTFAYSFNIMLFLSCSNAMVFNAVAEVLQDPWELYVAKNIISTDHTYYI